MYPASKDTQLTCTCKGQQIPSMRQAAQDSNIANSDAALVKPVGKSEALIAMTAQRELAHRLVLSVFQRVYFGRVIGISNLYERFNTISTTDRTSEQLSGSIETVLLRNLSWRTIHARRQSLSVGLSLHLVPPSERLLMTPRHLNELTTSLSMIKICLPMRSVRKNGRGWSTSQLQTKPDDFPTTEGEAII